ncbi:extracellular solute-binding protein [Azospirillum melinis]|uniref:Extracellular solute-binding protein n=1 Tax=Azospirillum melinis TaxID=328839 RepID=A0ABX2KHF2_9PROT|nr:ABC transporter substrate-binding protein [Azospirillum melinis]MBP2308544.1 iron(III) transport system substrate-binding protein [Azospirillum melinis]NUB03035.1 extracellular solute-binding protein [Azospirillum melinis]
MHCKTRRPATAAGRKRLRSLVLAVTAAAGAAILTGPSPAAASEVVVYCSVNEDWCREVMTSFERKTGIKALMTRKSAGEVYAQLRAEKSNPKADIWFGGSGDPHLQAAEEGLTEPYKSPELDGLYGWAIRQAEISGYRTVGIYMGALGFGYNKDLLAKRKIAAPACWSDLVKADFRDEIQIADPNSSGTAYTMLATMVQLMGEDAAFDYLKKLHRNVNQYTKSGAAPAKSAAQGETMLGIAFQHDLLVEAIAGAPVAIVAPCEGTGYEIGSMSLVKGARNPDTAKIFYDWALTPEVQALGAKARNFQIPSNSGAQIPPESPRVDKMKLISYDFARYGSSAERTRLLAKWDHEVKSLSR